MDRATVSLTNLTFPAFSVHCPPRMMEPLPLCTGLSVTIAGPFFFSRDGVKGIPFPGLGYCEVSIANALRGRPLEGLVPPPRSVE